MERREQNQKEAAQKSQKKPPDVQKMIYIGIIL
jgi:hypothetical protein